MQRASTGNARKSWVELTLHGFRELARGQTAEAARGWLEAAGVPWKAASFDPLYAASRSNAAAANLLIGETTKAERCFLEALEAWQRVSDGIEIIDVPVTGASSSFHFRLAADHPGILSAVRRDRYRRLAEAAQTITRFNRAPLDPRAVGTHKPTLSEILGGNSPEVRLLATLPGQDVDAIYAEKFAAVQEYQQPLAAALSQECAQLERAVALTALLAPSLFNHVRRGGDAIATSTNPSSNDV